MANLSVVEFSAVGEVRALGEALELIRARRRGDEAFDDALDECFQAINELDNAGRSRAVADLVVALARFGSVLAVGARLPIEEALDVAYAALAKSSLEHEPAMA